jgi:hypothetical protein
MGDIKLAIAEELEIEECCVEVKNLRQSRRLEFVNRSKRFEQAPPKGGQHSLNNSDRFSI